ncbi:MAG: hypothetical protein KBF47_04320 [Gemmatimonadales bacterium]|nr:hypothetical protein [Gemmatimonadales bacterium]
MPVFRTLLVLALVAAVSANAPDRELAPAAVPDSSWLDWNPTTRTMKFKLVAGLTGRGAKSPFNFNGYTDGEFTLVAPAGATVVFNFVNEDGTPHSAVVIPDAEPMPSMADQSAIPRAYSIKALEGLGYFATDVIRFKAAPAGAYRIFCGVPGHGLSGMWIRFSVDSSVTAPRMLESPTNR